MSSTHSATKLALFCLEKQGPISSLIDLNLPVEWNAKQSGMSLFELACVRLEAARAPIADYQKLWDQYVNYCGMSKDGVDKFLLNSPVPIQLLECKVLTMMQVWKDLPCWPQLQQRLSTDETVLNACLDSHWWNNVAKHSALHSLPELRQAWNAHHASSVWLTSINMQQLNTRFSQYKNSVQQPETWTQSDVLRWCDKSNEILQKDLTVNSGIMRPAASAWRWQALFNPSALQWMSQGLWEKSLLADSTHPSLLPSVVNHLKWEHPWKTELPFDKMSPSTISKVVEYIHSRHVSHREPVTAFERTLVECFRSALLGHLSQHPKRAELLDGISECDVILEKSPAKVDPDMISLVQELVDKQVYPWENHPKLNTSFQHQAFARRMGMFVTAMSDEDLMSHWKGIIIHANEFAQNPNSMHLFRTLGHASWARLQRTADPQMRGIVSQLLWTGVLLASDKDQKSFFSRFAAVENQFQHNPRLNPYFVALDPHLMDEVIKKFKMPNNLRPEEKVKFERVLLRQFTASAHNNAPSAKRKM